MHSVTVSYYVSAHNQQLYSTNSGWLVFRACLARNMLTSLSSWDLENWNF